MGSRNPSRAGSLILARSEPKVGDMDGKGWFTDDKLIGEQTVPNSRCQLAMELTKVVASISVSDVPFAISLDGEWGTGKTFFLERWKKYLENEGITTIYYNAWSDDDSSGDPLIPLLNQIIGGVKEIDKKLADKLKKHSKKLAKFKLRSTSFGSGIAFGSGIGGLIHATMTWDKRFDDGFEQARAAQNAMKGLLEELIKSKSGSSKLLVLIIDELDRCRPDYAIRLLERIKHLLVVPGMVFVYGINRRELCRSVASLYGEIDADGYLRRFFDMEFALPPGDSTEINSYVEWLLDEYEIADKDFRKGARRLIVPIIRSLSMSLRDIEHCVKIAKLVIANGGVESDGVSLSDLYATILTIIILRQKKEKLYRKFIARKNVVDKIIKLLNIQDSAWEHIQKMLKTMHSETNRPNLDEIVTQIELVSRAK